MKTKNANRTYNNKDSFTFIDLFAGIGGFRLGLESIGGKCVFSSEIDKHACEMYEANFGENPYNDITKVDPNLIPDFDILCAGFPCQSFSICGKQEGFYDKTRGTLFFDICRILENKKPKAFLLENVSNLEKHDKGKTLDIMMSSLNDLGYTVEYKVLNAKDFGVPQNRERIIIIGNLNGQNFDFKKLCLTPVGAMTSFLDRYGNFEILNTSEYTILDNSNIKLQKKSGLIFCGYRNKKIRIAGVRKGTENLSRVHKQPNRIYDSNGTHPTLSSQETSGRYFIKVDNIVRKLTIDECYRFMGFPENYKKIGTSSQLYARVGNSVCVSMIIEIAKEMQKQFFKGDVFIMDNTENYLNRIYDKATQIEDVATIGLNKEQQDNINQIVEKEETYKGVYTVLLTSLVYKQLYPNQDVRNHQVSLENGYSGRSFDTKYITPFMKQKRFLGAMKESGWLTRSLEQNAPFNKQFPGQISNKLVKSAFLSILEDIEENRADPEHYILAMISYSFKLKNSKNITIINPINKENRLTISEIIEMLEKHFYYKYKSRGASILPVIALYSIYQCIVNELKRFENKKLDALASHNSCDKSSGETGDIVIRNADNTIYEVVEVKFGIPINSIMIDDAYKKISDKPVQRYYVLSTITPTIDERVKIDKDIDVIREKHGCQFIINGIIPTLRYYLRLLENTDRFVEFYIHNIQTNTELNYEHKIAWNIIQKDDDKK